MVDAQWRCRGGATPTPLFELLATREWRERVSWPQLRLVWCDERFVPFDDERSNYGIVRRVLLPHVGIPAGSVHPVPTDAGTPTRAAEQYEETIRRWGDDAAVPAFDLVLLGLGDDGHTASLFPYSALLRVDDRLVAADSVRRDGTFRVTTDENEVFEAKVADAAITASDFSVTPFLISESSNTASTTMSQPSSSA